ncbi:MAG: hypothetical protein KTR31_33755 [Myxococcales bacterium]|nr:hypothetical protein [Myxococcales bacterium]
MEGLPLLSQEPEAQPFAACAGPFGEHLDEKYPDETVVGVVTKRGTGAVEDCAGIAFTRPAPDEAPHWFELTTDADEVWVFGWAMPAAPEAPAIGTSLQVRYVSEPTGWYELVGEGHLDVRTTDGELLMWIYRQLQPVEDLSTAPAPLSAGEAFGWNADSCGGWTYHDLNVDGTTVDYGGSTIVGDLLVRHGGLTRLVDGFGTSSCADWWTSPDSVVIHPAG